MTNAAAAAKDHGEPAMTETANADPQAIAPDSPDHDMALSLPSPALAPDFKQNPSGSYVAILALMTGVFLCIIAFSNRMMAPWLYVEEYKERIGETLSAAKNFAVHDLNVDIRGIRQAQIAAWDAPPDIMILGASHWQEAHSELTPGWDVFNGHVHRDYYDDFLAMVEVLIRTDKMPNHLVISIRDSTFTPPELRSDALWHPFIEEFRQMEARLDLDRRPIQQDFHADALLDLFSVPLGLSAVNRWMENPETPGPTYATTMESLDILLSDGSIKWSKEHLQTFTFERAVRESLAMAKVVLNKKHVISDDGLTAVDRLLRLLKERGVSVTLVHPPFNPSFYAVIEGTPYEEHLERVHAITVGFARKYGFSTASSFDPRVVGCEADMYIDAEHGRPACLKKVMTHIVQAIAAERGLAAYDAEPAASSTTLVSFSEIRREAELALSAQRPRSRNARSAPATLEAAHAETLAIQAPDLPKLTTSEPPFERRKVTPPATATETETAPPAAVAGASSPAAAPPAPTAPVTAAAAEQATEVAAAPAAPLQETAPSAAPAATDAQVEAISGGYVAQFMTTTSAAGAQRAMARMHAAHGDALPPGSIRVVELKRRRGRALYVLRSRRFEGVSDARALCRDLKLSSKRCFALNAS